MGNDSIGDDDNFAYATPSTPPSAASNSNLPPETPLITETTGNDDDDQSRVFSTKNMVTSTLQLKVHSVTMHTSTASLLSPRRKKRPSEFRSMLRRIRRLNLDNTDDAQSPKSNPD